MVERLSLCRGERMSCPCRDNGTLLVMYRLSKLDNGKCTGYSEYCTGYCWYRWNVQAVMYRLVARSRRVVSFAVEVARRCSCACVSGRVGV